MPSKVCGREGICSKPGEAKCLKAMLFIGIALTTIGALGFSEKYFTRIFHKSVVARNLTSGSGITLTLYSGFKILCRSDQNIPTTYLADLYNEILPKVESNNRECTEEEERKLQAFSTEFYRNSGELLKKCEAFLKWPFYSVEDKATVRKHIEAIRASHGLAHGISGRGVYVCRALIHDEDGHGYPVFQKHAAQVRPIVDR